MLSELSALLPYLNEQERAALDSYLATDGLLDFIPSVSPRYAAPHHLAPLVSVIERIAAGEPVRVVAHTPPRHGKTETLLHAFAWILKREPTATCAYASYAAEIARSKSRRARQFALTAGVRLADDASRVEEWRTTEGGGLLDTGIGGPLTGHGVSRLLVVDDPVKNRVEAESALMRERHWEWFNEVAFTRLEDTAGVIVNMARWHPDDLAGRLVAQGWEEILLPAMGEHGPLWPARYNADHLAAIREQVGEYTWASLYQGAPRARGGSVFGGVSLCDEVPRDGLRVAIGVDLAYSAKTHADYSVAVVLGKQGDVVYVLDVRRVQTAAPAFVGVLSALARAHPGAPMRWYAAGTEKGSADFIRSQGVPLTTRPPVGDKFVRAQPVAAAWNAGRVRVPRSAPWADALVSELASFTGVADAHDDQVDALAAAFDALSARVLSAPKIPDAGTRASEWSV